MSGELNLKHVTSGATILALILGQNRTTRWNGTAMAAINTVSDANWTTGMIALVEQQTQSGTRTATYVADFPAGLTQAGEYAVEYYLNTAATPGSLAIGVQDVCWKGTALATIPGIQTKTDNLPSSPAAVGSAMILQSTERTAIATALLDLANTIDGKTLRQVLQIIAAVLAGKVSGAGSGIENFRSLDDSATRVVVTADVTGNRTNVTYS